MLKMEAKMRSTFETGMQGPMPDGVVLGAQASSQEMPELELETVKAQNLMGTEATLSMKRLAAEAGLVLHGEVIRKIIKQQPQNMNMILKSRVWAQSRPLTKKVYMSSGVATNVNRFTQKTIWFQHRS